MEIVPADAEGAVARATSALDAGELVLLPLDQRYVLATDALDDDGIARLVLALGRGADDPVTIAIAGYEDLHHVAYGGALAREVAEAHWPGPTSIRLKARPWLPDAITVGGESVLVTAPARAFARDLGRHFGPYAFGALRATTPEDAREAVVADARLLVDAGALPGGRARVIDALGHEAKVIRDGAPAPER